MSGGKVFGLVVLAVFGWLIVWPIIGDYGLGDGIGMLVMLGVMVIVAPVLGFLAVRAVIDMARGK